MNAPRVTPRVSTHRKRPFVRDATHVLNLSDRFKDEIAAMINGVHVKNDEGIQDCMKLVTDPHLDPLREELSRHLGGPFSEGWVMVKNLPLDNPDTMTVALSAMVATPFRYEKEGPMVMDIRPQQAHDGEASGTSYRTSDEFPLHTDMSYVDLPPDLLTLLSIQEDVGQEARSLLSVVKRAIHRLDQGTCADLAKAQYQFTAPDHYTGGETNQSRPILVWEGMSPTIRFRGDTLSVPRQIPNRARAFHAAEKLAEAMRAEAVELRLMPGSAIIFDNRRVSHARSQFTPSYNENDRHIKRVFSDRAIHRFGSNYNPNKHSVS